MIDYQQLVRRRVSEVETALGTPELLRDVVDTLGRLTSDPWLEPLRAWLLDGAAAGDGRYELRTAARAVARVNRPRRYLEIGVRRGWSLAQVVAEVPDVKVLAVDLWATDYAGAPNPGPGFVTAELRRAVPDHRASIAYLSGDSRLRLPTLFDVDRPPRTGLGADAVADHTADLVGGIDLVVVDGDHSVDGARADLSQVMPRVSVGGALIFDDLPDRSADSPAGPAPATSSLRAVWDWVKQSWPDWTYLESSVANTSAAPGCGIAIRTAPTRHARE